MSSTRSAISAPTIESVDLPPRRQEVLWLAHHAAGTTDGRQIWKQTVGVPEGTEGDEYRTFTLLTMEEQGSKMLYVRLQGQTSGTVYGCYNLGPDGRGLSAGCEI